MCELHNSPRGTTPFNCEPPFKFKLFVFPTEKKNSEARKRWIKLIKRQGPKGQPCQPKSSSRVFSVHFVSGKPTAENPDPTLHLDYAQTIITPKSASYQRKDYRYQQSVKKN